jgi:trimeric autotransporter adhesin
MKIIYVLLASAFVSILFSETLFEIKDSSNNKVFDISNDGLRVYNLGDTLMVISSTAIKANIGSGKGLSRSFCISTASSKGFSNAFEVGADSTKIGTGSTTMGLGPGKYTDFSPANIFLGLNSGNSTTGLNNLFLGNQSGYSHTTGYDNVFMGTEAGYYCNGPWNVLIGYQAGKGTSVNTGSSNVCIGQGAGQSINGAIHNVYIGRLSGNDNATGTGNVYLGSAAGRNNTGSNNTFLGYFTGINNASGNGNTLVGHCAGPSSSSSLSGNICIGYYAGSQETGSNRLYIDNSNTTNPLFYGQFDNNRIGINDSSPSANLHIKQSGTSEEGLAIENDGDTDYWSWEVGDNDLDLYFNGTRVGYWDDATGSYNAVSDRRLKKDISNIDEKILNKILQLKPVEYRLSEADKESQKAIGFIAQDVKELLPSAVREREDGYLSINYDDFGVLAIKAIQEQQEIINDLKKENAGLKERLDRLEKIVIKE